MRFVGFNFPKQEAPFEIRFKPEGWQDHLTASVARSTAHARSRLLPPDKPGVKPLTPVALQWNPGKSLPSLSTHEVINSLVAAVKDSGGVPKKATATQLPQILSQRANVLSYGGMSNVICAGFMIATFEYKFSDPPPQPGQGADYYTSLKKAAAQDVVVATAYNLAKKKTGSTKTTMVHIKSKKKDENLDQVHTEQLLCAQLDVFLGTLKDNARKCEVVNVYDRWQFKDEVTQKGFDFGKLAVNVKIVFEHVDKNVKTDCDACSATIKKMKDKWGKACRSFDVAVTKGC